MEVNVTSANADPGLRKHCVVARKTCSLVSSKISPQMTGDLKLLGLS